MTDTTDPREGGSEHAELLRVLEDGVLPPARNQRLAIAAAIRALEAKVREAESEHAGVVATLGKALRDLSFAAQTTGGTAGRDEGLVAAIDGATQALSLIGVSRSIDLVSELRADRDRLAGEVERLQGGVEFLRGSHEKLQALRDADQFALQAEVARLTSELAREKNRVDDLEQSLDNAIAQRNAAEAELAAAREALGLIADCSGDAWSSREASKAFDAARRAGEGEGS